MKGINLALFDFDRHNALYYFILNSDEEIYLRYGGRDSASATTYLNAQSFDLALRQGLKKHQLTREKKRASPKKEKPIFPRDIPSLNRAVVQQNRCVECHLIADYQAIEFEELGNLFKPRDLYQSPDIKNLGIELVIKEGLVVKKTPGLLPNDLITHINDNEVLTFADLQYQLNKIDRAAKKLTIGIQRAEQSLEIGFPLPREWWVTDLTHRRWTIDPQVYFQATPLTSSEKKSLKLPENGFASRVVKVGIDAILNEAHTLKVGDIITATNGLQENKLTQNVVTHLKLNYRAGSSLTRNVIRDQKDFKISLKTGRLSYRK